jgi:hypothetical protein
MAFHFSFVEFLATAAYLVIFGFLWRTYAARNPDSKWSQAMSYIY